MCLLRKFLSDDKENWEFESLEEKQKDSQDSPYSGPGC